MRADIDVLGVGGAGVHADLAAEHQRPHRSRARCAARRARRDRDACDSRWSRRRRQKVRKRPVRDDVARDRPRRSRSAPAEALRCLHRAQHAERDQMAIGRRVRDVAGAEECRRREACAHADEIVGTLRQHVTPAAALRRACQQRCPATPDRRCRSYQATYSSTMARVAGCVVTSSIATLAEDPDLAPVAQRLPVLGTGPQPLPHLAAAFASRIACQTRSLVAGMSSSRTPSGASACMIAIITAGSAPTQPASPAPLAPSGLLCGRHRIADDRDVAHVVGARHRVIHEARSQQLAGSRLVDHLLHQDLADALRDAAMDLAGQRQRIDHRADVVDHQIATAARPRRCRDRPRPRRHGSRSGRCRASARRWRAR